MEASLPSLSSVGSDQMLSPENSQSVLAGTFNSNLNPALRLAETAVNVRQTSRCVNYALLKLENPRTVMIVTKLCDDSLAEVTKQLAEWFMSNSHACFPALTVYVDSRFAIHPLFKTEAATRGANEDPNSVRLLFWDAEFCRNHVDEIDFIITLGGDGTVLYTSWLFQQSSVPLLIPFHFGSLGFLTVFHFLHIQAVLEKIIGRHGAGVPVTLRMRLECTVWRKKRLAVKQRVSPPSTHNSLPHGASETNGKLASSLEETDSPLQTELLSRTDSFTLKHPRVYDLSRYRRDMTMHVLNEIVIERGPCSCLTQLELYADKNHLTTMQADGVVVATPTGSTAYSLSAGGSLVHPSVPAMLITPIAPHTLSFRPMILPDTVELRIEVPKSARTSGWTSFDGRNRVELFRGDQISITASPFPVITVSADNQHRDWFASLNRCLNWNARIRQQGLPHHERPQFKSTRTSESQTSSTLVEPKASLSSIVVRATGKDTVDASFAVQSAASIESLGPNDSKIIEKIWESHQSRKNFKVEDSQSDSDDSVDLKDSGEGQI